MSKEKVIINSIREKKVNIAYDNSKLDNCFGEFCIIIDDKKKN